MPYYCTVPRCTSMAGKAKNVSFHQFPRDEQLAKLWNKILKRGKPYTKYSKVCSLHFKPEDYTVTSAGKYKGQWRTLRKDAVPSQNLPSEAPAPYQRRNSSTFTQSPSPVDPRLHQHMAQAIYVQTMLAMQAAGVTYDRDMLSPVTDSSESPNSNPSQLSYTLDPIDNILHQRTNTQTDSSDNKTIDTQDSNYNNTVTYKCNECSKCFKDPDVFLLHKRVHTKNQDKEKENLDAVDTTQETLKANPILANLLKSGVPQGSSFNTDLDVSKAFDTNVMSIESQIMTALAANMESYLRNLSTIMTNSSLLSRNGSSDHENTEGSEDFGTVGNGESDDERTPEEVNGNFYSCDNKDLDESKDSIM